MNHPNACSDHYGEGPTPYDLPIDLGQKQEWKTLATRRHFLAQSGQFLGALGLAKLLGSGMARGAENFPGFGNGVLGAPHHQAKAKRVIQLFMAGGPPHMDTWDCKPGLAAMDGQDMPASALGADFRPTGMTSAQSRYAIKASPAGSKIYGQCGRRVSDLLPWTAKCVDDLALIHSMHTDAINHEPAILLMNTANMIPGRPALGAWVSYGLGSSNANLPSFVVLNSNTIAGTNVQSVTPKLWSSGFLPTEHAGVPLRTGTDPVLYLSDPASMTRDMRRAMVDGVAELNRQTFETVGDPETHARIQQYEMAFNMQMSVPELTDLSREPQSTWDLYGPAAKTPGTFAYNCLMARRLAERGVCYTQVYQRGWDFHGGLNSGLHSMCGATDRASYALITDLKQRGLLEDTLVVWGGEFGRTVYSQGTLTETDYGRDHHPRCFSLWMTGAGIRKGTVIGETDDYGYNIVKDPVSVHDLHATLLHLLGIDHTRLTFRFQGRDYRLTDVFGEILKSALA
jgi:hypothetical protein